MNAKFPGWLADWLGIAVGSNSQAVDLRLESTWQLAPWASLLLVSLAIFWTFVSYAGELSGVSRFLRFLMAGLRLLAIALLLVMLAHVTFEVRVSGPPAIALVIDTSASMGLTDHYDDHGLDQSWRDRLLANNLAEATRLNIAKTFLSREQGRALRELADRHRVTVYACAGNVKRISDDATPSTLLSAIAGLKSDGTDSESTRLGDALLKVRDDFRSAAPAAVLLFSDGVVTRGVSLADAAQQLRAVGIPLYAVGIGSPKPPTDIEISDVLVDDVAFVNDAVSIQTQIKATGLEGQSARVVLRRDGASATPIEKAITLPADGKTLTVQLMDRPTKVGDVVYTVEIDPRNEEANKTNNKQSRHVSVRDDKIRVLLAQGYPNYEFRYLKSLLERDQRIQLSTYLQEADAEYAQLDKSALRLFPASRDKLLAYDVLVLGDLDLRVFPSGTLSNLKAVVIEDGRGLVSIPGPKFSLEKILESSDLADLLPVRATSLHNVSANEAAHPFNILPTPLGLQHPMLKLADLGADNMDVWSSLAPIYWQLPVADVKPAAQVLAKCGDQPAIIFQYVGAGRVLFHSFDSTWRWRIGNSDKYFARYWFQAVRFLAHGILSKGTSVQLTTDRREYRSGETVRLRAKLVDRNTSAVDDVTALVRSAGEPDRRIKLQRNPALANSYEGSIANLSNGKYDVLIVEPNVPGKAPAASFSLVSPPGELATLAADGKALAEAAEATQGKFYTLANMDQLWSDLPAGQRVPIEKRPPIAIWNRWWILAAFLSCLTLEWILRKRASML